MLNKELKLASEETLYNRSKVEQIPIRNGFGEGLVIAGDADPNVIVLCADLSESTRSSVYQKKYPNRYIEVGVAEQNMAALASGLAAVGKVPFISSYAMFSPGRNWEQIRTTICYNNQNVKVAAAHAGISVGPDGATHQAIEDIGIMRAIANMIVLVPADSREARRATVAAAKIKGPVYIRYAREKTPVVTTDDTPFEVGKAYCYREGKDVVLVAAGPLVYEALLAAEELAKEKISACVINAPTIKPLDEATIIKAAKECGAVVSCEEHQIINGLGSAVAEALGRNYPTPQEFIGVQNRFGESGEPDELMDKFGLRAKDIAVAAKKAISRKEKK